jgi:hypothetical protein
MNIMYCVCMQLGLVPEPIEVPRRATALHDAYQGRSVG